MPTPLPENEALRLAKLRTFEILHTAPEDAFDHIAALAQSIFRVPIALVSLVDEDCQWFKARVGVDVEQTPREHAFCAYAIMSDTPFVIPDAARDDRFRVNPLVLGPPHVRFYAGAPLVAANGVRLGTVCVLDRAPRSHLTSLEIAQLQRLAALTMHILETRRAGLFALRNVAERKRAEAELGRALARERSAVESRDRLLASVGREMGIPLNSMMRSIALSRRTETEGASSRLLDEALEFAVVLRNLVDGLFEAASIDARQFQPSCVFGVGNDAIIVSEAIETRDISVLIADDDATSRFILEKIVSGLGWESCAVEDGALALEAARQRDFDVILMDLQMPVLGGVEAMQHIRALKSDVALAPIIAISEASPDQQKVLLQQGFSAFVPKLVFPDLLVAALSEVVSAKAAATPAGAPRLAANGGGQPNDRPCKEAAT